MRQGRAAGKGRADPGEDFTPEQRRHSDSGKTEDRVIARDRGRDRVQKRNCGVQDRLAHRRERDLSDDQGERAGDDPGEKRAADTRVAVERGHAGGQSDEKWQGVDGEGEDQPAEEADAEHAEDESDDKHGGSLRDKRCDGPAFHHHHGAAQL